MRDLSDVAMAKLDKQLILQASPEKIIPLVADAYEYAAQRVGEKTYILFKRYSSVDDLAFFSLPEAAHRLTRLIELCRYYMPPETMQVGLRPFLKSLSEEQKETVANGVMAGTLPPEQKENIRFFINEIVFGGLTQIKYAQKRCRVGLRKTAYFGSKQESFPVYAGEYAWNNTMQTELLTTLSPQTFLLKPDPYLLARPASISTRLDMVVSSLPSLPQWNDSDRKRILVDAEIANLPIYVEGLKNAPVGELLTGLAQVTDTRLVPGKDTLRFTVQNAEPLRQAEDIPLVIDKLVPAAFFRCFQATIKRISGTNIPSVFSARALADLGGDPMREGEVRYRAEKALVFSSTHRLRNLIDPLMEKRPDGRLFLSEATDEMRSLLVLRELALVARYMVTMKKEPFHLAIHLDEVKFKLKKDPAFKNVYTFDIRYIYSDGKSEGTKGSVANP